MSFLECDEAKYWKDCSFIAYYVLLSGEDIKLWNMIEYMLA